jgi:hypothetical protein
MLPQQQLLHNTRTSRTRCCGLQCWGLQRLRLAAGRLAIVVAADGYCSTQNLWL